VGPHSQGIYLAPSIGSSKASQLDRSGKTLFSLDNASAMTNPKSTLDELRIDRSGPARSRLTAILVGAILLVALVSVVVAWWLKRPQTIELQTFVVRETSAGSSKTLLNASGYVVARREATVSSKVTGKVVEVLIEEGMKVKEGQVLARLDDSNVIASLRLAEAEVEAAKSALSETRVRVREAELELRRVAGLAAEKIATQADLDRAEAEVNSLKARLERQLVEVSVSERQVALWEQQKEDNIIRAPFPGVVTSKNAQPGEMISPISAGGGFTRTGIGTIVDMDSLEIEVDVNESYINRVVPGQPVEATLDAYSDWKIPSKVIAIIPTADRQKATVKVRLAFEKLDPRILPQMGVKVAFQGGDTPQGSENLVLIPKSAARQDTGKDIVFVLQNGRAERRAITIGEKRAEEIAIRSGLSSGEKIILNPPVNLRDGDSVREAKR
jgi:HlyD family secretion protein